MQKMRQKNWFQTSKALNEVKARGQHRSFNIFWTSPQLGRIWIFQKRGEGSGMKILQLTVVF